MELLGSGDDWEHEETFTDDDEAVGNDPEEREEQVPEGPAPPEIKQVPLVFEWLFARFWHSWDLEGKMREICREFISLKIDYDQYKFCHVFNW